MIKRYLLLFFFTLGLAPFGADAMLSMELTRGVAGAIPIAVVPFSAANEKQDISIIIANDLQNSGRFKVFGRAQLNQFPHTTKEVVNDYFRHLGTDNIVIGRVTTAGQNKYKIAFDLVDVLGAKTENPMSLSREYTVSGDQLRAIAHHISDLVYEQMTGTRGIFSTKIAYVVVQRAAKTPPRYILEVSDQDGYNPKPLLTSPEPIMSPSWSPNGKQIAYVSFEKQRASIFLEDVISGQRQLLSEFPGINGAPAWSPDGKKLALVLSKSGAPNIYVMDIQSRTLKPITHDFYINTEPAWSPDGKSLLFTSNRSDGKPQIYEVKLASGDINRISFDGDYNARAAYTPDGKGISMIHRVNNIYNIALLNLETGTTRVLNSAQSDSASPSLAPNGSMVLYDTIDNGRNVLAMVSADGRIQLRLPARNGEAQDPAWSPFLS